MAFKDSAFLDPLPDDPEAFIDKELELLSKEPVEAGDMEEPLSEKSEFEDASEIIKKMQQGKLAQNTEPAEVSEAEVDVAFSAAMLEPRLNQAGSLPSAAPQERQTPTEYILTRQRMCSTYLDAEDICDPDCPLYLPEDRCKHVEIKSLRDGEEAERLVADWGRENPATTNETRLYELFPELISILPDNAQFKQWLKREYQGM